MLKRFLAAFALAMGLAAPAAATTVLRLSLDQIIDDSATAFQGTCLGNRTELDAKTGFVVTYTTFAVHDALKGTLGATHEIKQVGGELPAAAGGLRYRVIGVPKFRPGAEYVVFLAGKSSIGFSSPIGLSQGRFDVRREGALAKVGNGRDFREMAGAGAELPGAVQERIKAAEGAVQELDLDDFKRLVRQRVGAKR